jgi:putative hydrolase of the HAD superfamily
VKPLRAVLFDVDFTLCRPGPELGPEGYTALGSRFGLRADAALYDRARLDAVRRIQRHPELEHDDEVWVSFAESILRGMGATGESVRACAKEMTKLWERSANFELYDDVQPVLRRLRACDLKIGLISNTGRDLVDFAKHHDLDVDASVSSRDYGKSKPHPGIFRAVLELLEVAPGSAVMVGDSPDDDVAGARMVGMDAYLIDRDGLHPDVADSVPDLVALYDALEREGRLRCS